MRQQDPGSRLEVHTVQRDGILVLGTKYFIHFRESFTAISVETNMRVEGIRIIKNSQMELYISYLRLYIFPHYSLFYTHIGKVKVSL